MRGHRLSCPDWRRLLADRERAELAGDSAADGAWSTAVDHLRGCASCRAATLELDPALLFVARPPLEVSDDEVDLIKANVRTLRRSRRAERASGQVYRGLGRVAAAAAIVTLMVLLPTRIGRPPLSTPPAGPSLAGDSSPAPRAFALGDAPAPTIETLDLPEARIYQLGEKDLSVVMVFDESIDI